MGRHPSIPQTKMLPLILILHTLTCLTSSSYIPPYYEGSPRTVALVSLDPPDFRGSPVYRIEFTLNAKSSMPQEGFIHRNWEEFQKFDHLVREGLEVPAESSRLHEGSDPTVVQSSRILSS